MVLLKFQDLVFEDHFAETEAVLGLSVGQVSKDIFGQQIGSILVRHIFLCDSKVMLMKLLDAIKVGLEHVIDFNCPKLNISE